MHFNIYHVYEQDELLVLNLNFPQFLTISALIYEQLKFHAQLSEKSFITLRRGTPAIQIFLMFIIVEHEFSTHLCQN